MDLFRRDVVLAGLGTPLYAFPALAAVEATEAFTITAYKVRTCGCCNAWIKHVRDAGFPVIAKDVDPQSLWSLKAMVRIKPDYSACHTAWVEGYVVEGHVPADDIRRLLDERPDAIGLAVPGMPIGSPGMEMGDQREPFETLLIRQGAAPVVFARHR